MQFPYALRALNHRNFRLYWTTQAISLIGSWCQIVAQSLTVMQLSPSPLKLGLFTTLQFTPVLLFSLAAGVLTDRVSKRKLILATQSIYMLLAFGLSALVWSGQAQYWHLCVFAVLLGLANSVDVPARQAYFQDLVGKENVISAVSLQSAAFNAGRILGPAVAGGLVGLWGTSAAFLINGLSYLPVLWALARITVNGDPAPRKNSVTKEVAEGVSYAVRTPETFFVLLLVLVISSFVLNFNITVPLFAVQALHRAASDYGVLMAALGAGALAAAISLASSHETASPLRAIVLPAAILCGATIALSLSVTFGWSLVLLAVAGYAQITWSGLTNNLLQMTTPDHLRGRILALYSLVFSGAAPVGSLLMGVLAEGFGARVAMAVGGVCGAIGLAGLLWWRHARKR